MREELSVTHPHLTAFLGFLDHLNQESHRGAVLISCGFLEQQLEDILLAFMRDDPVSRTLTSGGNAPLSTFSSRIGACFALGLIDDVEHHDITILRRIRNEFAHRLDASFEKQNIVDLCKNLKMKVHDHTNPERGEIKIVPFAQYTTAATGVILSLVNRPHYVAEHRRASRVWPR